MAATDIPALRIQILGMSSPLPPLICTSANYAPANAKTLIHPKPAPTANPLTTTTVPSLDCQATLQATSAATAQNTPTTTHHPELEMVVVGHAGQYRALIMLGATPAIESEPCPTPESAVRKLFLATAELLTNYIPAMGGHQRNIHGGGVYDEDLISGKLVEVVKKG
ncbi:hypothetical protein BDY17DRAFT_314083 [Neohortaea acidophila]|uniref:Uncharacterized protein n=1 Tax=Neohortaea acidophila TaxID=245834 RepID=A0A6A6PGI1_9PEZI|nr:uncharacterized protein BDY17DRAFT_314083 [Neohortaea acidophila]KAF2478841.1 hypothetical protein BDY17DRAFT_314083 [Neohortaea acidophila]